MSETARETAACARGLDAAEPLPPGCGAGAVLRARQVHGAGAKKDARAWRQPSTGVVETSYRNDHDILARFPRIVRWMVYGLAALTLSGLLPMAVAEWLIWFTETFNVEWLAFALFAAEFAVIFRMIGR